jgi:hypothetical protein
LNFQTGFSSARRQLVVPFSIPEFKGPVAELGGAYLCAQTGITEAIENRPLPRKTVAN